MYLLTFFYGTVFWPAQKLLLLKISISHTPNTLKNHLSIGKIQVCDDYMRVLSNLFWFSNKFHTSQDVIHVRADTVREKRITKWCMHMHVHVCMYAYTYLLICVRIYICIYVHIYISICMYTHIFLIVISCEKKKYLGDTSAYSILSSSISRSKTFQNCRVLLHIMVLVSILSLNYMKIID